MAIDDTPGDELTAAEQAYMESGGENAAALLAENAIVADAKPDIPVDVKPDAQAKPDAAVDAKPDAAAKPELPEDDAADDAVSDPKKPPPKTVSFHKYQRELTKAKERAETFEKQARETAEKFARGDERLKLLTEALTSPQPAAQGDDDPEPDPQQDIFAYVAWQRRQIGKLQEGFGQTQQANTERQATEALQSDYRRDAVAFVQEKPDFGAAYQHLLQVRGGMLAQLGYNPAEIATALHNEERGLVERARTTGRRPAEVVYAMAQQLGYRTPQAADPAPAAPAAAVAAETKPAETKPSVTEELERIQRGQAAGKSLSGAGGAANELSFEALASMPDDEFNAMYAKNPKKVDAIMGARR